MAISTPGAGQEFEHKHISYALGLSNSQISSIKQDHRGTIWVGTQGGGVYGWDGHQLRPLSDSVKYEIIDDILPDGPNRFWVATLSGQLFKFDGRNEPQQIQLEYFEANERIAKLCRVRGHVLGISQIGSTYLLDTLGQVIDRQRVSTTASGGRAIWRGDTLHLFNQSYYAALLVDHNQVIPLIEQSFAHRVRPYSIGPSHIHKAADGWWVQVNNSLHLVDGDFRLKKVFQLPFDQLISDLVFWQGYWWFSTEGGLYRTQMDEDRFDLVQQELQGFHWEIFTTSEGLWVSALNGLHQFTSPVIQLINPAEKATPNGYFAFAKVRDALWAGGMAGGIHVYQKGRLVDSVILEPDYLNSIRCFQVEGDSIWIGVSGGLLKMQTESKAFQKDPAIQSSVLCLETYQGKLVAGSSRHGFYVRDQNRWQNFGTSAGLNNPAIWALAAGGDQLFVGTESGLQVWDGDTIRSLNLSHETSRLPVTAIEPLADHLMAIGFAKGGVIIYDLQTEEIRHHFTDQNGLSGSYIYFLKWIDSRLWVGSSLGVDQANVAAPYEVFQLRDVGRLGGAETFLDGVIVLEDEVWVSTIAGTISVPRDVLQSAGIENLRTPVIERMEPLSFDQTNDFLKTRDSNGRLLIPFGHGSIKFHFSLPHFTHETLRFIYQLEGYDSEPSEPVTEMFAVYKQLPPGRYSFKVWRSFGGRRIGPAAKVDFYIPTPIYYTTWFRVTIFLLLAGLIGGAAAYRVRLKTQTALQMAEIRQEAQDELRREMARDFHDEMGNHLAKIINLSGVLKMWGLQPEQAKVVDKIERAANTLFISTKDLIWSLKKENNNLEEVYFHVKDFSEQLFDRSEIILRTCKKMSASHVTLNPQAARDLSLMMKEALTNVYKHSGARNVELKLEIFPGTQAVVTISDDGSGCAGDQVSEGNGLRNMTQRASRSALMLDFQPNEPQGCRVIIWINGKR